MADLQRPPARIAGVCPEGRSGPVCPERPDRRLGPGWSWSRSGSGGPGGIRRAGGIRGEGPDGGGPASDARTVRAAARPLPMQAGMPTPRAPRRLRPGRGGRRGPPRCGPPGSGGPPRTGGRPPPTGSPGLRGAGSSRPSSVASSASDGVDQLSVVHGGVALVAEPPHGGPDQLVPGPGQVGPLAAEVGAPGDQGRAPAHGRGAGHEEPGSPKRAARPILREGRG